MSLLKPRKRHLFRTPKFFQRFRRNTGAAFCTGNQVDLFRNGGEFFPSLFQEMERAVHTICVDFYIIRQDGVGGRLAEALKSAAAHGVKVFVMYDYIGCFDTPNGYFRDLERSGVHCVAFNPPPFKRGIAWFDKRDHRKMAIIDGHIAFTGGINIGDEYDGGNDRPGRWRDLGVKLTGPAACELHRLFCANWREEGGADDPGDCWRNVEQVDEAGEAEVMIVNGGPHHNRSVIRSAFRMAIAGASESIQIINPYFVPGPRVARALIRAVKRGVRVQLILPAKTDVPLVRLVSRSYYSVLLHAGIEIYEREGTILHAKVMLVDDYWAVIGSANLDHRSFHRNYETNLVVDNLEFGGEVKDLFNGDLAKSRRIALVEHERRGVMIRLLERLCQPVSWFL